MFDRALHLCKTKLIWNTAWSTHFKWFTTTCMYVKNIRVTSFCQPGGDIIEILTERKRRNQNPPAIRCITFIYKTEIHPIASVQ